MLPGENRVEDAFPPAFDAAENASARGQWVVKRAVALTLLLMVLVAAVGLTDENWSGWVAAVAFLTALVVGALALTNEAERNWYDGRAAAESLKTLSWKYAVGGTPFPRTRTDAESAWASEVRQVLAELRRLDSPLETMPPTQAFGLREVRALPLPSRRAIYQEQRLEDQRDWYSRYGKEHRDTANRWRAAMFVFQVAGVACGVAKGLGVVDVDLLAVFGAAAASAAAWIAVIDYAGNARAYEFAALELAQTITELDGIDDDEETWARFVADAEEAMSREHTMWTARRRAPRPG